MFLKGVFFKGQRASTPPDTGILQPNPFFTLNRRSITLFSVTTIAVAFLMMAQGIYMRQNQQRFDPAIFGSVVSSTNQFALDLYRQVIPDSDNVIFSPLSVSTALMLTMLGAQGQTRAQIIKSLHFNINIEDLELHTAFKGLMQLLNDGHSQSMVKVANQLFASPHHRFLQDYLLASEKFYKSPTKTVDFSQSEEAVRVINKWVAEQTENKIQDLLGSDSVNALTRLVLVNAVYFKGVWLTKFSPKDTTVEDFHVTPTETIVCKMMHRRGKFMATYSKEHQFTALQLPYCGKTITMLLLLPDRDISHLESTLTLGILNAVQNQLKNITLSLSMPKFTINQRYMLGKTLGQLGIKDLFDSSLADLSGMDGRKGLYISEGYHEAYIEVNEEGTEAAAATAMVATLRNSPTDRVEFNRPFLFLVINQRTDSVLFLGRMKRPPAVQKQRNEL